MDRSEDFQYAVKRAAEADLRESKYSAAEVARAIAALTGHDVTAEQLAGFVSVSSPIRMPLDLLPAWVRVTGSRRIMDCIEGRI